jgi:hypothetical protein
MPFDQAPLTTLDAIHPLAATPDDDPSSSKRPIQLSKSASTRRRKNTPHRCEAKSKCPEAPKSGTGAVPNPEAWHRPVIHHVALSGATFKTFFDFPSVGPSFDGYNGWS